VTLRTRQAILLLSLIPALVAGFAAEWSIRAIADTPAGWIPVWVTLAVLLITNGVLRILVSLIKRVSP